MDQYIIIIIIIGLAALGMAWMPSITRITKISYSLFYVILGAIIFLLFKNHLPVPDPIRYNSYAIRITELVVIISLMGTGLKIDQPFSFRKWKIPFRLVSITMILSIIIVATVCYYVLHFDLASSVLMGAVLAPTDPVLASDVQVGPPNEGKHDNIKFSLTAEAGMNDGTAFPFTWLAILLLPGYQQADIQNWIVYFLLYKVIAGVLTGYLIGRFLAYLFFRLPEINNKLETRDGLVAIAATLVIYGICEMIHGYGFIAVFIAAITIRNYEMTHKYHKNLHEFTDQVERILLSVLLLLFGGSLVGGILDHLTWPMGIFSAVFVLVIRPLTSLPATFKNSFHIKEKLAIGFFGIKGMGSFYYLAFALAAGQFLNAPALWSLVSFTVLLSIFVHGITATAVMNRLDKQFVRRNFRKQPVEKIPA